MCRLVSESVESSGVKQVAIKSDRSVFLRPQQDTDGPALGEMLESCSDQT